jgi:hypothetical protein
MTIKVKITHDQPNYPKGIIIQTIGVQKSQKHQGMTTTYQGQEYEVAPGMSMDIYVWDEQEIHIREAA